MPLTKEELDVMSYKDVVKLAQENGVYNRKSSKKATLIKKLCALWMESEEIENQQPWTKKTLTPLREVDESNLSNSEAEDGGRRKTFTKVAASNRKSKSTNPPVRQRTFTKDDDTVNAEETHGQFESSDFAKDAPSGGSTGTSGPNDDVEDRRKTFTKGGALKKSSSEDNAKCTDPPKRQRTFTKEDSSTGSESQSIEDGIKATDNIPAATPSSKCTDLPLRERTVTHDNVESKTPSSRKRTRENTFKMTPEGTEQEPAHNPEFETEVTPVRRHPQDAVISGDHGPSKADFDITTQVTPIKGTPNSTPANISNGNGLENEPITSARKLARRSTFKFSPAATPSKAQPANSVMTQSTPVRRSPEAATTPKTPSGMVKYQPPPATAPPIEKLSVFERLSVRLSSSARRSLVASERKSVNQTPTSAKRSNLEAIRSLRQNKTNFKNLRFASTRTDTTKTPNQPGKARNKS